MFKKKRFSQTINQSINKLTNQLTNKSINYPINYRWEWDLRILPISSNTILFLFGELWKQVSRNTALDGLGSKLRVPDCSRLQSDVPRFLSTSEIPEFQFLADLFESVPVLVLFQSVPGLDSVFQSVSTNRRSWLASTRQTKPV